MQFLLKSLIQNLTTLFRGEGDITPPSGECRTCKSYRPKKIPASESPSLGATRKGRVANLYGILCISSFLSPFSCRCCVPTPIGEDD